LAYKISRAVGIWTGVAWICPLPVNKWQSLCLNFSPNKTGLLFFHRTTSPLSAFISMKLTVGQYQALYAIAKSEDEELEKSLQSVAIITGKTQDEVEAMPLNEFNALNRQIVSSINSLRLNTKPVSFLKANGRLYQVNYKIGTLRAGQNTELQHWLKEKDWIVNMDKILASVVVPVKKYLWVKLPQKNNSNDHSKVCEDMQDVDFSEAFGCVVFFCKLFIGSIKAILPSLEKDLMAKGKTKAEVQTLVMGLTKTLDGFTTQNGSLI
jgi:hypothetical protein